MINPEDYIGKFLAISVTGKGTAKLVIRPVHDQNVASGFAEIEVDELKGKRHKRRYAYHKVFVVEIKEMLQVNPELQYKPPVDK